VELPFDVLTTQVQDPYIPPAPRPWPRQPGDPAAIAAAARLLAEAKKPILFVGSQIWWDDAADALRGFAGKAGLPTFMTAMGRGALPAAHPLACAQARKRAFRATDLVLVVGTPLDFRVGYGAAIDAKARIVQIERDPTRVGTNREAHVAILGDARSILAQLADAVAPADRAEWIAEMRAAETKAQADTQPHATSNARPINHYRLARAIGDAIDDDTILIGDGGDCVALGARVIPLQRPGQWLDPGPLGCLGV